MLLNKGFWSLHTKQPNKWYHKLASILDIYYCWLNKKLKRGFFARRQKVMKSHEIESRGTSWTKYLPDSAKRGDNSSHLLLSMIWDGFHGEAGVGRVLKVRERDWENLSKPGSALGKGDWDSTGESAGALDSRRAEYTTPGPPRQPASSHSHNLWMSPRVAESVKHGSMYVSIFFLP